MPSKFSASQVRQSRLGKCRRWKRRPSGLRNLRCRTLAFRPGEFWHGNARESEEKTKCVFRVTSRPPRPEGPVIWVPDSQVSRPALPLCLIPDSQNRQLATGDWIKNEGRLAPATQAASCKCDVLKVRRALSSTDAAAAFPSVPPTKSGEFAHVSRTGRHGGISMAEARSQTPKGIEPGAPAEASVFSSTRRPRQRALRTSHSVVARDFARGASLEQGESGPHLCRSCGVFAFLVEIKGKAGGNRAIAPAQGQTKAPRICTDQDGSKKSATIRSIGGVLLALVPFEPCYPAFVTLRYL